MTRRRAAASVALGLFVGALPLFGLHFPLCIAFAVPFKLDAIRAYVAANISNPLVAPFLITAEVQLGSWLIAGRWASFDVERARAIGIAGFAAQAALGSVVVGAALAVLGAVATALLTKNRPGPSSDFERALERTEARYATVPRGHRFYVSAKLRSDPVVEQLAASAGDLGAVVDLAAGRGQLGLLLLELGRATSVTGLDWDENKLDVARRAAAGDATFTRADLRSAEIPRGDTLLLVDVLHYLDREQQDDVLGRAAASLNPGGKLLIREIDSEAGLRARLTRAAERWANRLGLHRGAGLRFRPVAQIVERLTALGLGCSVERAADPLPLANALIVARRPVPTAQEAAASTTPRLASKP